MNEITLTAEELVVEPRGLDKLWSFTRELRIPLTHVRGATADPGVVDEPRGIRAPGLAVPGKYAGTFHRGGEATFWNVSDPRDNLVVELRDEKYVRLVLTVADPTGEERRINAAAQGAN
ncbi:hypothetical protein FDO65_07250 [Nakamurella flava]|uniref:Uncharacterized protein n=1 Tax=Nakamurella flava TaxID=2576308 RepID=A0A4U6QM27_9ACTN|nr:hypothetical protein [Nakamurella flava]TKV61379.1 hypothetical protein FDO65_07250 [Nakamurella flava]